MIMPSDDDDAGKGILRCTKRASAEVIAASGTVDACARDVLGPRWKTETSGWVRKTGREISLPTS